MAMNMVILYATASVAGLGLLIFFIYRLVAPSAGWTHDYNAFIPQALADIPRAGRYDICVSHDRFALLKGRLMTPNWDWFPAADFMVARVETNEPIPYSRTWGMTVRGMSRISVPVGCFDAPAPGKYLVTNLFTYRFTQGDEIRIRRHQSFAQSALSIMGIIGSASLMIFGGVLLIIQLVSRLPPVP